MHAARPGRTVRVVLVFLAACVALVAIPGPNVLFVLARGLAGGRRAAVVSVLGVEAATACFVAAAAFGLTALLVSSAIAFAVVRYAGAAYLLVLAVRALRSGAAVSRWRCRPGARSGRRSWSGSPTRRSRCSSSPSCRSSGARRGSSCCWGWSSSPSRSPSTSAGRCCPGSSAGGCAGTRPAAPAAFRHGADLRGAGRVRGDVVADHDEPHQRGPGRVRDDDDRRGPSRPRRAPARRRPGRPRSAPAGAGAAAARPRAPAGSTAPSGCGRVRETPTPGSGRCGPGAG